MKYLLFSLFSLSCLLCSAACAQAHDETEPADPGAYEGAREDLHVYLLIGQSNMAGRAAVGEDEQGEIQGSYLLNGQDTWEIASNPLNRHSTIRKGLGMQRLGPGYSFARTMLENNEDISIGLVVNAKGGSSIEEWEKGTKFYNEALRRLRAAAETGTIKGILWHQGESNAEKPEGYLEKLQKLIADLREDLGMPDLPFIAGQINNAPAINEQIAQLPEAVPATRYARSEGLTCTDRWHFDTRSTLLLGQRYAEQMIALQEEQLAASRQQ